jgi:tripartite-type tricarboxylate transporter receptor subunit TctC
MGAALGQQIVVENMTGAGGSIGVGHVVRAAPDGYTVSVGNWSTHVVNGEMYSLPYDLLRDLEPVALLPSAPQLIVARKSIPANNLGELVNWLKQRQAVVGTAGVGSAGHVSALLFQKVAGVSFSFAPYRGAGPAMLDLLGEHLDVMFDQVSNSLPNAKAGGIKAYAVTRKTRLASAPDIPTVDEAGLPDFHISVWSGLWLPKGAPAEVVAKLNAAAVTAMTDPQLRKTFADLGLDLPGADERAPAALANLQRAEIDKWWPLLKAANVKAQ